MKNNASTENGLSFTSPWSHDLPPIFFFLAFSIFLLSFKSQIQENSSSYKLNFSFPSLQSKRSSYSKWYADFEPWKLPDPISDDFKLSESIEPRFRPFRWGPEYQVTMGIRSLDPTQWITLHSSYPSYIRLREARHSVHKSDSYRILPSNPSSTEPSDYSRSYLAALETARCISAFLATRYPKMFQVEPKGSNLTDDGWGIKKITRFEIGEKEIETGNKLERKSWNLLGENEVLFDDDGSQIIGDNPIKTAGELIPDDLAILLPDPVNSEKESKQTTKDRGISEEYRLIAGSICTAGFWRLKDKIGRTLREIHLNGKVPQYETKLEFPMNKFFSKLAPNKPVERNNYFFQILSTQDPLGSVSALQDGSLIPDILHHQDPESSPISGLKTMSTSISSKKDQTQESTRDREVKDLTELSWSHSTNGPETLFDQGTKAPKVSFQENEDGDNDGNEELIDFKAPEPTKEKSAVVMRTERQTLRRLRRSGAIVFTIRTYIVPVTTMAEEPGIPGRLASAIRSWSQDVRAYKGGELYEDVLLPYLDEKHQQQLRDGLIEGEEIEREKSRKSYPL